MTIDLYVNYQVYIKISGSNCASGPCEKDGDVYKEELLTKFCILARLSVMDKIIKFN